MKGGCLKRDEGRKSLDVPRRRGRGNTGCGDTEEKKGTHIERRTVAAG